ncbi:uncharacterized protein K452DRAFT_283895 [Aplosporella prunicola CBS 121167]|uniref:Uncharacterized protein n=1 Tax=Aplosporella prunicola CBS 121167 TaxID=1176127 RepID=A0A6A6BRU1_9PEZI|nr:uncharacterized protein K452DRAFT_283895 [Aplosporella prunicola CBS 121167]KAF2145537.1 hypothetical protein K452DRAFT_283895 [Aplosporella prunicola CBS 121167]
MSLTRTPSTSSLNSFLTGTTLRNDTDSSSSPSPSPHEPASLPGIVAHLKCKYRRAQRRRKFTVVPARQRHDSIHKFYWR